MLKNFDIGAAPPFVFPRDGAAVEPGPGVVPGWPMWQEGDWAWVQSGGEADMRISAIKKSKHTLTEPVRQLVHQAVTCTGDFD